MKTLKHLSTTFTLYFLWLLPLLVQAQSGKSEVYQTNAFSLEKLSEARPSVLYFLSPECPLCINYTVAIKKLQQQFDGEVDFYGVFPSKYYAETQIVAYVKEFELELDVIFDFENRLTKQLGATITPEVVLLDSNGERRYSGKIDNWIISLGKKRNNVTRHYLRDAIIAVLADKEVKTTKTGAVGCIIER